MDSLQTRTSNIYGFVLNCLKLSIHFHHSKPLFLPQCYAMQCNVIPLSGRTVPLIFVANFCRFTLKTYILYKS
jgi:hypothetical protein